MTGLAHDPHWARILAASRRKTHQRRVAYLTRDLVRRRRVL